MLSFYDWYADLPIASPQVFGDQTDVPESGDWWEAAYLMLWGSDVPVSYDRVSGGPVVPNGTLGDRWGKAGEGRWNLDLGDAELLLTFHRRPGATHAEVVLPRFDEAGATVRRTVPAVRLGDRLVTRVFDLMPAQYGVGRDGLGDSRPVPYEDAATPCTPPGRRRSPRCPPGRWCGRHGSSRGPPSRPGAAA